MGSRLEQFIRDHREAFDDDEPPKRVWDQIQQQTDPARKEPQPVIWLGSRQWSVAAAVSLLIAVSVWSLTRFTHPRPAIDVFANPARAAASPATGTQQSATAPPAPANDSSSVATASKKDGSDLSRINPEQADAASDADYREEMVYYAGLVRLKHKELKRIEKDEPLLYRQFAGDIKKLDSVYRALETQLPKNSNHEQLLEAMVQDLQLQMRLLNHQLGIIKQINHSKKTAYEKAYKNT